MRWFFCEHPMTVAYVDCFSGLSGDMFLGAVVDAGLSVEALRAMLGQLPIAGYRLEAEKVTRQGLTGHAVKVTLDSAAPQPPRHLAEVESIIRSDGLPDVVRESAVNVFRALAEAEATVHGTSVEAVHFHEVGAVDAIVDVVGTVWGLAELGVDRVYASSVPTGSGTVQTSHGLLPVPAPATLALLQRAGAPVRPSSATTELVTPTGAALLTTLATFAQPPMQLGRVGYGFGQKALPWPNVARLWLGEPTEWAVIADTNLDVDEVVVIEANLDDENPEIVGAALDALLGAGALDVFFTPIQMKKNRPAVKLTVIAPVQLAARLSTVIPPETSTLGVRTYPVRRFKAVRWQDAVETPWGRIRVKVKAVGAVRRAAPEYDDCLRVAREQHVPLPEVYRVVNAAALRGDLVGTNKSEGERA
jgi:pyridinium-3,5-bisthiocarboxylic acid mononucleotide nickel chelatase